MLNDINLNNCPSDTPCYIYGPHNETVWVQYENEFNWIRLLIQKNYISGWRILFNGAYIDINSNGLLDDWPTGLFDTSERIVDEILNGSIFNEENDLRQEMEGVDVE